MTFADALLDRWRSRRESDFTDPLSQVCAGRHFEQAGYQRWLPLLEQTDGRPHRKVWEWCYILQALDQRGLLTSGSRAIGFGVGTEPLVAAFASLGLRVLATDQAADQAASWALTGQHATATDSLRRPAVCSDEHFDELVTFRAADMRSLPSDLGEFDIAWSSCCFEHLGSPRAGFDFVLSSMDVVRPGGIAVHTTEIDCTPGRTILEAGTVAEGDYVCFYRREELEQLVGLLRRSGYQVQCNYHIGRDHPLERDIDRPPYTHDPHVRLGVQDHVITSFGLTVLKNR